jgi:prepilin-type processing-associated H-X9-DG protein
MKVAKCIGSSSEFGVPFLRLRAFTLVELLVIISILGFVVSMILPAVVSARAAARNISCSSNLRQIGVGLQNFESSNGRLPGVFWGGLQSTTEAKATLWSFSPSSSIASFIDSDALGNRVPMQMTEGNTDPTWMSSGLSAPEILHCPADAFASGMTSSYRYCRGNIPLWPADPGGSFVKPKGIRLAQITDGLSNTAFASERLVSVPQTGNPNRDRDLITANPSASNDIAPACISANMARSQDWSLQAAGVSWLSGRWLDASYYHLFPPNSSWVDCVEYDSAFMSLTSARSYHPGGVNVLFGDGHVKFVGNGIAPEVWRGCATRNGSEGPMD